MHPNVFIPQAFLDMVEQTMPAHLDMQDFIAACQRPLRRSIRVNTLKTSRENFLAYAKTQNWTLSQIPWCEDGFWIEREDETTPLGNTAAHLSGLFYIQEASSMLPPAALFDNNAPKLVLDMAAAPGSKTTQIAALMNNHGGLVANEYAASRVKVLSANVQRCGVTNAALTHFDANVFGDWLPESFDSILLDAPCSGEGTIRKDADAMKNWSIESTLEIANKQCELIESAFYALKPGGSLVYSTCTLNADENQAVCQHLKDKFAEAIEFVPLGDLFDGADKAMTNEGFLHVYPQVFDSEGFFIAKMIKRDSVTKEPIKKRLGKFPFMPMSTVDANALADALAQSFDLAIPEDLSLWQRDKEVWLFPKALEGFIGEMRFSRIGLKLAESILAPNRKPKKNQSPYRWQHQGIIALSNQLKPSLKSFELSTEQARDWYMGRDIRLEDGQEKTESPEALLFYQETCIGAAKWVSNRLKNTLPRELVRDQHLF